MAKELPPTAGSGLSWQRSSGEGGTSHGGDQGTSSVSGEEREARGGWEH